MLFHRFWSVLFVSIQFYLASGQSRDNSAYECDTDVYTLKPCASHCCIQGGCADNDSACRKPNTLMIVLIVLGVVACLALVLLNYWKRVRMQRLRNMRRGPRTDNHRLNRSPAGPNDPVWQNIQYEKGLPIEEAPVKPALELHYSQIEYGKVEDQNQLNNEEDQKDEMNSPAEYLSIGDILVKPENEGLDLDFEGPKKGSDVNI